MRREIENHEAIIARVLGQRRRELILYELGKWITCFS